MVPVEGRAEVMAAQTQPAGPADSASPWSRLWDTGVLHSCATGIQGNYDGPILAFWQRQFDVLEDGARVVDIGTGNGALLLLARERARQRGIGLKLHGVDIADIDPTHTVPGGVDRFAGIEFHPRTSAHALPFADGEVDLVCSQFGFEYAPRDTTLDEIARVARERSRIALVLHSDDSVIARVAVSQREGYRFLRRESRVIEQARAMVPIMFHATGTMRGPEPLPGAESARLAFNRSAQELMDAIERLPDAQILRNAARQIGSALEHAARSPEEADRALRQWQESLRDEDLRTSQQQEVQLSATDLHALAGKLEELGYDVRHCELEQRPGVKIGWSLEAIRA